MTPILKYCQSAPIITALSAAAAVVTCLWFATAGLREALYMRWLARKVRKDIAEVDDMIREINLAKSHDGVPCMNYKHKASE